MKFIFISLSVLFAMSVNAQSLQFHYNFDHTVNPGGNPKNYPTLYFEYFKTPDSGKMFIKPGSFLLKMQADFAGDQNNIGKYYMQVSQELRFWQPKYFIDVQYSGGLGVTNPVQYSYYILNTYSVGVSHPFRVGDAYFSTILFFKYVPYTKPTRDFLYTFYFYKGLWNYKAEFLGDFSIWTENKNHGDVATGGLQGKRFFFFAEPQFWYNLNKTFAIGSKLNTDYHVLTTENLLQFYPTAALRIKL